MKLYTVSYFSNGEREASDGVYDVCSSMKNALKRITAYTEEYDEQIIDASVNIEAVSYQVYTDKGMYIIETFILDEEC